MSKKFKPQAPIDKEPNLDMSSMIDVSFLLLIFFLLTSTLDPKEGDLGMKLPGPPTGPIEGFDINMEIEIQANGSIIVDRTTLDTDTTQRQLPLLDEKLKQYKAASDLLSTEPLILVQADDNVPGQRFVDVLNALAKVEIKNVTIVGMTNEQ